MSNTELIANARSAYAAGDFLLESEVLALADALEAAEKKLADAWDEGNAEPGSGLPRCPACDDRPVSLLRIGDRSEWRHDDDGTVICGGSFTDAVRKDHNPYRVNK